METTTKEKLFYQDGQITVSQARFVTPEKTYAMSNISSVSLSLIKKSRVFEILLIIAGVILLAGKESWLIGIALLAIGIIMFFVLKDKYAVRVSSNSGESNGFISTDKDYIVKIVDAVNEAIIHRG